MSGERLFILDKLMSKVGFSSEAKLNEKYSMLLDEAIFKKLSLGEATLDDCIHATALFSRSYKGEDGINFAILFDTCVYIHKYIHVGGHISIPSSVKQKILARASIITSEMEGKLIIPSALFYLTAARPTPPEAKDIVILGSLIKDFHPKQLASAAVKLANGDINALTDDEHTILKIISDFWNANQKNLKLTSLLSTNLLETILVKNWSGNALKNISIKGADGTKYTEAIYPVRKKLGKGVFGDVVAVEKSEGIFRAAKSQRVPGAGSDGRSSAFIELAIMSTYKNPHIASAEEFKFSYDKNNTKLFIVMPIATIFLDKAIKCTHDEKEWYDIVIKGKKRDMSGFFPDNYKEQVGMQICEGLRFLHGNGILHLDLKPENISLTYEENSDNIIAKIADFGSSIVLHNASFPTPRISNLGTPLYMSPEQLLSQELVYTTKQDIWSLGVTLAEMEIGTVLFDLSTEVKEMVGIDIYSDLTDYENLVELMFVILGTPTQQQWPNMNTLRKSTSMLPEGRNIKWLDNCTHANKLVIANCVIFNPAYRIEVNKLLEAY